MRAPAGAVRALLFTWLIALAAPVFAEAPVAIGGTELRFAGLDEARAELSRQDDWVAATSALQRAATLGVSGPVTPEAFAASLAPLAREWTSDEARRWQRAAEAIAPRLAALGVRLPGPVLLVMIDGRQRVHPPHTRGRAIFLPQDFRAPGVTDDELLAHELFHVLTRHDPRLADRIYALLGFAPAAELEWPEAWLPLRLANPDAPRHRHALALRVDGEDLRVMPVLVAKRAELGPGEGIFDLLDVRLLILAPPDAGAASRAAMRGGQPRWLPAFRTREYLDRLGGNTRYVLHPEETAADNFSYLVSGRQVPNPRLLQQLQHVLLQPAPPESKP